MKVDTKNKKEISKYIILSRYNPTHETIGNCGGIFNKIDDNGMIICAKCGDMLLDFFDELAQIP